MYLLEIIAKVNEFSVAYEIPKEDLVVTHGAALVLLGVNEEANDVDITVPPEVFQRFVENGFNPIPTIPTRMLINATVDIDIHDDIIENTPKELLSCQGVYFTNVFRTFHDYVRLGREKDKEKIDKLTKLLTTPPPEIEIHGIKTT